ncbi:hypothetical protein FOL46_003288 [Perkinsus olseni]|uniref:Uncharacterized protein n=1 Tax=Perkinsus olseni TaxID=32597 RepID=A0A7J6M4U6_PEROL|nr:hypothetical protein FOL46_003288 [Perkinsus olseni]
MASSSSSPSRPGPSSFTGEPCDGEGRPLESREKDVASGRARIRRSLSCSDLFRDMFCLRRELKLPRKAGEQGGDGRLMKLWRDLRCEVAKWAELDRGACEEYCRCEDIDLEVHWSPSRWFASRQLDGLPDDAKETVLCSVKTRIRSLQRASSTSASDGGGLPLLRVRVGERHSIDLQYGGSCTEDELREYLQERLNALSLRGSFWQKAIAPDPEFGQSVVELSSPPSHSPPPRPPSPQELVLGPKVATPESAEENDLEISTASAWWSGDDKNISSSTSPETLPGEDEGSGDRFFIGTPHDGHSDISWVETSSESSVSPGQVRDPALITNSRPRTPSPTNKGGWLSSWLGRSRRVDEPTHGPGSDRWEVSSGTSITSGASVRGRSLSRGHRSAFRRENRNLLIAQATGQGAERHKFLASLREEGRIAAAAKNREDYKSDELFVSQSSPAWAW